MLRFVFKLLGRIELRKKKPLVLLTAVFIIFMFTITTPAVSAQGTLPEAHIVQKIRGQGAWHFVDTLADPRYMGREAGTPECDKAAKFIAHKFMKFGLTPGGDHGTFFQEFDFIPLGGSEWRTTKNVIGVLLGTEKPDEYIVIGAHYDHVGIADTDFELRFGPGVCVGADDDASGIAVLLETARLLASNDVQKISEGKLGLIPPRRTIIFAAWSGEEAGLKGSAYFVMTHLDILEDIIVYINLDMVGYDDPETPETLAYADLAQSASTDWPDIVEYTQDVTTDLGYAELGYVNISSGESDCLSFEHPYIAWNRIPEMDFPQPSPELGCPVMILFEYDFHLYYHSPLDTPDTVSPYMLKEAADITAILSWRFSNYLEIDDPTPQGFHEEKEEACAFDPDLDNLQTVSYDEEKARNSNLKPTSPHRTSFEFTEIIIAVWLGTYVFTEEAGTGGVSLEKKRL